MQVQLPTQPALLRSSFSSTRTALGGQWQQVHKSTTEVPIFSHVKSVPSTDGLSPIVSVARHNNTALAASFTAPTPKTPSSQKNPTSETVPSRQSAGTISGIAQRAIRGLLSVVMAGSVLVGIVLFVPNVYYQIFPADTQVLQTYEPGTPLGGDFAQGAQKDIEQRYLPPVDPTLPEGEWLIIPRIGVRTELRATTNPDEALEKGVWMVPDFGQPEENELPIILAAHRFGWKWWWQSDYWKYHSFYLLPETEPGDQIEILYNQRKWVYEIYAGEEGEEITDYNADVILYTCKFLNSPLRHFRYARLVDPTKDSQATGLSSLLQ